MDKIDYALNTVLTEANELCIGTDVVELDAAPTAIEFARSYYAKNVPVVIRNCIKNWPALTKWTPSYFQNMFGEKLVDVTVTPNGYADGIAAHNGKEYFVMPLEENMKFSQFLDKLDLADGPVYYIQKQNSNFTTDFAELAADIDESVLDFAQQSFNKEPDAVNFWMGDHRAVTSMHKDPYDNLYCVISGYKHFILLPPFDVAFIPRKVYPNGIYKRNELGEFYIEPVSCENSDTAEADTEWISIDAADPDLITYPAYAKTKPLHVSLNAGDVLFLPNYWFHHVRQSHKSIAINYWYDMEFDSRYCYFRMMEILKEAKKAK